MPPMLTAENEKDDKQSDKIHDSPFQENSIYQFYWD